MICEAVQPGIFSTLAGGLRYIENSATTVAATSAQISVSLFALPAPPYFLFFKPFSFKEMARRWAIYEGTWLRMQSET
jgi:hypothetical protein